ncbi:thiamine diphosphokinase [Virgibacillus sediminis]|uniref:Thiamine diphosphokinase n=1 Tax=Virgibacillus sediminis TaxID=202260 RepID=A0ABV7ABA1_9BACI
MRRSEKYVKPLKGNREMTVVGIVGNGPPALCADLAKFTEHVDVWIGADRGAMTLVEQQMPVDFAVGDFDSVDDQQMSLIKQAAASYEGYPSEKDETDLEIALLKAFDLQPHTIYLFGVTGGRLDHELVNIQLLYSVIHKGIRGIVADSSNLLEMTLPGSYQVESNPDFPLISFIPYSREVSGLSLSGFKYPLVKEDISWGSTLCISNELISKYGTFSFDEGILLLVKSRDTIPF